MTRDEALRAAVELAEDMIGYVPEHFRKKWAFDEELDAVRRALSLPEEPAPVQDKEDCQARIWDPRFNPAPAGAPSTGIGVPHNYEDDNVCKHCGLTPYEVEDSSGECQGRARSTSTGEPE